MVLNDLAVLLQRNELMTQCFTTVMYIHEASWWRTWHSHRIDDRGDDQIRTRQIDDENFADSLRVSMSHRAADWADDEQVAESTNHRRQANDANVRHRESRSAVQQWRTVAVERWRQVHFFRNCSAEKNNNKKFSCSREIARRLIYFKLLSHHQKCRSLFGWNQSRYRLIWGFHE